MGLTRCYKTTGFLHFLITRSSATAEIARDAGDVDFSVDDVHTALTLAFHCLNSIVIL